MDNPRVGSVQVQTKPNATRLHDELLGHFPKPIVGRRTITLLASLHIKLQ